MIAYDIEMLEKAKPGSHKKMFIEVTLKDLEVYYLQQPVLRILAYLNTQMLPSLTPSGSPSK